jgi:hypothetical protein
LLGVLFGVLNARPLFDNLALRADNQARADRTLHSFSIHHLLAERLVFFHYLRFRVGQKHERQIKLFGKLVMGINAVFTDTQNYCPGLFHLRIQVAEPASFFGSARGAVLGIKKQDNVFAAIILKRVLLAVIAFQAERRRFLPLQTLHALPSFSSSRLKKAHSLRCAQSARYNVLAMYASARRLFARLASEIFLSNLHSNIFIKLLVIRCEVDLPKPARLTQALKQRNSFRDIGHATNTAG